jgi:hypothetical protein
MQPQYGSFTPEAAMLGSRIHRRHRVPTASDQGGDPGLDPSRTAVLFLSLFGIAAAPVILTPVPPLVDYPNHLALLHVLVNHSDSPFLQRYYDPNISFNQNMGLIAGALPMAYLFGAEAGLKLFTIAVIFVLTSGVLALHRTVHQRWSLVPCAAFLLVYNRAFLWGLLSFLFSLGLVFWGIAGWIKARDVAYSLRSTLAVVGALVLAFSHLFAFAIYLLVVAGYELARIYRAGKLRNGGAWLEAIAAGLPLLAPLLVIAFTTTDPIPTGELHWGSIVGRLEQWAAPFLGYNLGIDAAAAALLAVLVLFLFFNRNLTFAWSLVGGLLLLMLVQMGIPEVVGGTSMADRRIPVAWFLLLLAALDVRATSRVQLASVVIVSLVFLVRLAIVTQHWYTWGKQYHEYVDAFDATPRGAKLLGGTVLSDRLAWVSDPRIHAEAYAVVVRDAFVASLFAAPLVAGQHLAYRPSFVPLARATMDLALIEPGRLRGSAGLGSIAPCYDYVLVNAPVHLDLLPASGYAEVFRGTGFRLFRREGAPSRDPPCAT